MATLAGSWRSDLNADSLVVQPDGRFRWGRPYTGRFTVFSNGRIFMSLRENGRLLGGTPLLLTQSADTVRLTPADGTQMAFYRVLADR
jgi:hypothetical protein